MVYENFSTFTEVDEGDDLTIVSNTLIRFDTLDVNLDERIFKYYGEKYFGDCEIQVQSIVTSITTGPNLSTGQCCFLGLGGSNNRHGSGLNHYGGFLCYWRNQGINDPNALRVYLGDPHLGTSDNWANAVVNTQYYFTLTKTNSDCTLYIYDDAPRTNLVDTLAITTVDLPYDWIYASGMRYYDSLYRSYLSGKTENLEIISGGDSPPSSPTSTQDFTSFTEVDPNAELTIISSTRIKCDDGTCNDLDYTYKNYGAGFFGDFIHRVSSTATNWTLQPLKIMSFVAWSMSNGVGAPRHTDWRGANDGLICGLYYYDNNSMRVYLKDIGVDSPDEDNYENDSKLVVGYKYHFEIERSGPTLTCKVYQDKDFSILLDTLAVSCATTTYQYLTIGPEYYSDANRAHVWGLTEFLRFLNPAVPDEPGESGPSDGATNSEWPTSDLYIDIPESEGDVTVYFYDEYGNLIGQAEGEGGDTVTVPWNDLDCEETYGWYVVIDNGTSTATSILWYFTCGSCDVFTISSESHPTIHLSHPRFGDGIDRQLSKELQSFNFWSDNWAVHDNGVESEPLTLIGEEWMLPTGDMHIMMAKFDDINDLMNKHEEVAVSGLGDCVDGYYYIKDFSYDTIKGSPYGKAWRLQLEFSRVKTW